MSPFNFDTIKHFHASKFFLSCRSLNDVGLLEDDENLVKFVTSILRISDEIILLIDNSKFYKNDGSFIICSLDKIDTVITNQSIAKLDFLKILELLLIEIKLYQMSFRYCFFLSLICFLYNEVTYKHL